MTDKRIITPEEVKEKMPERFWSKIKFGEPDECWEWQAAIGNKGYGFYNDMENDKTVTTHRHLYKMVVENIPKGKFCLHTCDNRRCVNPAHLFAGTQNDNMQDMIAKGRAKHDVTPFGSKHKMSKLNEEQVLRIKHLLSEGKSYVEIAKEFNVWPNTIGGIARGKFWKHVAFDKPFKKAPSWNQILNEEKVLIIKMRLAAGESFRSIAKSFNVKPNTIYDISKGRNWKHVILQEK